jgi:DNA segregation ATPase FtsK/SpoIIIE, S-DNA-T family
MASRIYAEEYGLVEWLRAHRIELGPAYAAIPVLLLGVAANLLAWSQAALLVAATAVGCAFWVGRAHGWRKPYFAVVSLVACGWVGWAHYTHDTRAWAWLLVAWFAATIVLAIPWWSDHVRRTQVQMENVIRSWSIRADRIRLKGTAITGVKGNDTGWSARLSWLPGAYNVDHVAKMRGEIEGALGLNTGELRIAPDGRSSNSVTLVAVTKDPHAQEIPWEIPHTTVAGQAVVKRARATDKFPLGLHEDSSVKTLALWLDGWGARQVLGAGIKGSGKSNLFNLFWGYFALCTDVVQWGIDLKGGMELGPWRGVFDWMVYKRDEAVRMMAAADALIEARMAYCAERKMKVWKVTPDTPLLVITIDEAASLLGDAKSSELHAVEELARKGRAVGLVILVATQYPTLEALGSNQIRQQIDQRFCFRMADDTGENYIVPGYTVDAHKIPADRPGTCYHLDGESLDPMPFRTYRVHDETIAQLVSLLTGYTPILDAVSARAAETVLVDGETVSTGYAERDIPVPVRDENGNETTESGEGETVPEWTENGEIELDEITARRTESLSPEQRETERREREAEGVVPARLAETEAYAALVSALRAAGLEGTTPAKLMAAATRKSTWLYDKLEELEEAGQVKRTRAGLWAWTGASVHVV